MELRHNKKVKIGRLRRTHRYFHVFIYEVELDFFLIWNVDIFKCFPAGIDLLKVNNKDTRTR